MKKYASLFLTILLTLTVATAGETETLRKGFHAPPPGGGAQTWWHWTSLFITEKGITADLEAMKAAGYETAHIFTTSSSSLPPGEHPEMLTDGWMAKLKFAGEEMQRLARLGAARPSELGPGALHLRVVAGLDGRRGADPLGTDRAGKTAV